MILSLILAASLLENIDQLNSDHTAITNAIAAKGVMPTGGLNNVSNDIMQIQQGGGSDKKILINIAAGTNDTDTLTIPSDVVVSRSFFLSGMRRVKKIVYEPSAILNASSIIYNHGDNLLEEIHYPNLTTFGSGLYILGSIPNSVTDIYFGALQSFSNNRNHLFFGRQSGTVQTRVHFEYKTCSELMNFTGFPGLGSAYQAYYPYLIFVCSDGEVRYVNGAWTKVTD